MRGLSSSGGEPVPVVRVGVLVVGIVVTTVAFLGLVDEQLAVVHAAPWWWVGLVGIVVTLVALGSPWHTGGPED